jgi:hypothetical protein
MADWKLQFAVIASQQRGIPHIESTVSTECTLLSYHCKAEKLKFRYQKSIAM